MPYSASSSYFSPRNDFERDRFDYRKLLVLVGAKLPDMFTEEIMKLRHKSEIIYRSYAIGNFEDSMSVDDVRAVDIKTTTFMPSEVRRFEFVTLDINGECGLPELAFGVLMRNGDLCFLRESECARIFSDQYYDARTKTKFSVTGVIDYLASNMIRKFYGSQEWPIPVSSGLADYLSPITGPTQISSDAAASIGEELASIKNIPFMSGGDIIQPQRRRVEVPDIPELEVPTPPKSTAVLEESRKLNPHFGALSF